MLLNNCIFDVEIETLKHFTLEDILIVLTHLTRQKEEKKKKYLHLKNAS